jgi:hypothetical protein
MTNRFVAGLALLLLCGRASAWEARAAKVPERLRQLSSLRARRPAKSARKPGWIAKPADADGRIHWSESFGGKSYFFGVGKVANVKDPALRNGAAEDDARASLAYAVGTPSGGAASARLEGSQILDWYQARDGVFYALAVLIR